MAPGRDYREAHHGSPSSSVSNKIGCGACWGKVQRTPDGATQKRQRVVVLSLPTDRGVRRAEIRRLTPELAEMYASKTDKTLTRDLNRLHESGLLRRQGNLWWSRIDLMDAFMSIARTSS